MKITIETIPHGQQRYETVGDWWTTEAAGETHLQIRVSLMRNWRYEAVVAFHELAEALLCLSRGIDPEAVDTFDKQCEADEPGDHPDAPYRREHSFATKVERLLAGELDVDWNAYDAAVSACGEDEG